MRAIASARALAVASGARLIVFWDVNADLGARYEELFLAADGFEVINVSPRESFRDALIFLLYGELERFKGLPTKWITRLFFRNRILRHVRPGTFSDQDLVQMVRDADRLLITSWWSFYGGPKLDFSFFALHPPEQAAVESISQRFTANTIGVHIRRTDNANAKRYSPTTAFIGAMTNRIDLDHGVRFFLATDCEETQQQMKRLFGERLITRARETSRGSHQGMRDAVVDLFLLARTKNIVGSYYSTFSETAASIGGIQWVTVTNDESLVGKCNTEVLFVPTDS